MIIFNNCFRFAFFRASFSEVSINVSLLLLISETLAQWVMENNFKPIVGYKCQFRNEEIDLIVDSEVLVVEKPYKLSYTW